MFRAKSQTGAGLVMVIGIVAALAILASSLVILVINAQSNTLTDRNRARSFNVAEAAVERAMYDLSRSWPTTGAVAFDAAAFKQSFQPGGDTSDFPDPVSGKGPFVQVVYFDNSDTNNNNGVGPGDAPYDANKDGLLYVEAQAGIGNSATRIQAQLQQVNVTPLLRRNVAVSTDGAITVNNQKPDIGSAGGDTVTAEAAGGIWSSNTPLTEPYTDALSAGVTGLTGSAAPSSATILPQDLIDLLVDAARRAGKYYTDANLPRSNETAKWEGVVVLDLLGEANLPNGTLNGDGLTVPNTSNPKLPGILIVKGPRGLAVGGNGDYYGLVYCEGPFTNAGNYQVHGMLIAKGDVTLGGENEIIFDRNALYALDRLVVMHVRIVGGTWREIQPVF